VLTLRGGPDDDEIGVQGTPEQLLGPDANWHLDRVDGGTYVWGPIVPQAAAVIVRLSDGTALTAEALPTVAGMPVKAFGRFVPDDASIVGIEARAGDEVLQHATALRAAVAAMDDPGDPELQGVGVLVVRGPGR
jgi:hypothetical protein